MSTSLEHYENIFYDLHTGVVGDHERPHKPAMLLAVIDLIESGDLSRNLIPFSDNLKSRFTHYYEIVKTRNDNNTPLNPYFYMRSEEFWSHIPLAGHELTVKALSSPPAMRDIPSLIEGARLAQGLWDILNDSAQRGQLRDVLVSRYFPQHRGALLQHNAVAETTQEDQEEYHLSGRSSGFRRIVVQVYEHQCAACGLRIRQPSGATIVDAAHIIPFSESRNDHPRNGLALCKNHHWAMDQSLIAPGTDHLWHISTQLDPRQPGERELLGLAKMHLILPKEKAYHPLPEALDWRESRLQ